MLLSHYWPRLTSLFPHWLTRRRALCCCRAWPHDWRCPQWPRCRGASCRRRCACSGGRCCGGGGQTAQARAGSSSSTACQHCWSAEPHQRPRRGHGPHPYQEGLRLCILGAPRWLDVVILGMERRPLPLVCMRTRSKQLLPLGPRAGCVYFAVSATRLICMSVA
jgi:hypothetical protein